MRISFKSVFILCAAVASYGFGDPSYFSNKRGNERYLEEDYKGALDEYLDAQQGDPEEKSIDYNMGGAYYKLGRYNEAARAYNRAVTSDDDEIKRRAGFNMGAATYKVGDKAAESGKMDEAMKLYKESARQYKALLKTDRNDNDARHNLELALAKIREMKEKKKEQKQKQDQDKQQEKNEDKQDNSEQEKAGEDEKKEDKEAQQQNNQKNKDRADHKNEKSEDDQLEQQRITKEQAQSIFDAIERDERKLKEKIRAQRASKSPKTDKDW